MYLVKTDCCFAPNRAIGRLLQDPFDQMVRNLLFETLLPFHTRDVLSKIWEGLLR